MDPRKLPPAVLMALGLAGCNGCGEPEHLGPCLSVIYEGPADPTPPEPPPPEPPDEPVIGPCLEPLPVDTGAPPEPPPVKPPPKPPDLGVCLSPLPPPVREAPMRPCLSVAPPPTPPPPPDQGRRCLSELPPDQDASVRPADPGDERRVVMQRLKERGALPVDLLDELA